MRDELDPLIEDDAELDAWCAAMRAATAAERAWCEKFLAGTATLRPGAPIEQKAGWLLFQLSPRRLRRQAALSQEI
jgi:hypothetical protein